MGVGAAGDIEGVRTIEHGRIPVGRVGTAEEVAAIAVFVCGEEAGFITGATLDVNGGLFMR